MPDEPGRPVHGDKEDVLRRLADAVAGHQRAHPQEPDQAPGNNAKDRAANELQTRRHAVVREVPVQGLDDMRHRRVPQRGNGGFRVRAGVQHQRVDHAMVQHVLFSRRGEGARQLPEADVRESADGVPRGQFVLPVDDRHLPGRRRRRAAEDVQRDRGRAAEVAARRDGPAGRQADIHRRPETDNDADIRYAERRRG